MSGRVKWKELCRVPEGEKEKGRQSREEGWTQKVEGSAGEMEMEEKAGRPPGKVESMTSFPSLINQITANHDITVLIFGRSVFFMYEIGRERTGEKEVKSLSKP